jgi:hypothetical protein
MTEPQPTADATPSGNQRTALSRFVPVTLLVPFAASSLGVDGGAIFTIVALDDLGFSSTTIGIAFGLGVVSIPVQLAAARIPLRRAERSLRQFLLVSAVLLAVFAVVTAAGADSPIVWIALVVTVLAEIAVSVLYATSWFPLQRQHLSSVDRQRLVGPLRALGGLALAGTVFVVPALPPAGRVALLVVAGAAWMCSRWFRLPVIGSAVEPVAAVIEPTTDRRPERPRISSQVRWIIAVFVVLGIGAWPLFLVYTADVLWPTANLGLVGATQILAGLAAALAWRPTAGSVRGRVIVSSVVALGASVVLASVAAPVESFGARTTVLVVVALATAASATTRLGLVELIHRAVDDTNAVRVFTVLDVIGSSAAQLGMFATGFVIAASIGSTGAGDLYRWALVITAAITLALLPAATRPARPAGSSAEVQTKPT